MLGLVARSVTDQAARELLNQRIGREFIEDAQAYYAALAAADAGDLRTLCKIGSKLPFSEPDRGPKRVHL